MKILYLIFSLLFILSANYCNPVIENESVNIKDLDENMIDIRVYHENLGGDLKTGDIDGAKWLLTGMDSILLIVSDKFTTHRKLDKPFNYFYEKNLKAPINNLKSALDKNDLPKARAAYILLTDNCNDCHINHDIDKEVQNWMK